MSTLEDQLKILKIKHHFDIFKGNAFRQLLAKPAIYNEKVKVKLTLRSLFFDTNYEIVLVSGRKLKKIFKLWRIPKEYQRHFVKDYKQQQDLLLALLLGEVDSQFIFGVTPTTFDMDAIDSQQRLTILKLFFQNKLPLPKNAILRFIGHDEGATIDCSNMYYSEFNEHQIFQLLMDTILDGVICETVVHEGPVETHIAVFNAYNTGNTSLNDMEQITAHPYEVFKYARNFNNFNITYDNANDDNWVKLNNLWSLAGLNGLRYEQAKLVLQCVCFEEYGWNSNISKKQMLDFAENNSISTSWKEVFAIFTKLHTDVITKKSDYDNRDLWGLQGWRVFLSFIRFLYRQEESIKIVVKDYQKFWMFAQDIMKDLRTTLGYNDSIQTWNFDLLKKHPSNNMQLIRGLVDKFEKIFENANSHDEFLELTGISVRDGKRIISWSTASLIWQLQNGKCAGCGTRISVHNDKDHKTPWSRGGKGTKENAQILCDDCHNEDIKKEFMNQTNDSIDDNDDTDE